MKSMKRLFTGTKKDRPELNRLLEDLQSGDTLVVTKLDRIARSASQGAELIQKLLAKNVTVRILNMGVIDGDGYLYLKGRCKSMILGPSGQNIYPEEIESILNNMPYVVESLVVEDDFKLVALVYPDFEQATEDGLDREQLLEKLKEGVLIGIAIANTTDEWYVLQVIPQLEGGRECLFGGLVDTGNA